MDNNNITFFHVAVRNREVLIDHLIVIELEDHKPTGKVFMVDNYFMIKWGDRRFRIHPN